MSDGSAVHVGDAPDVVRVCGVPVHATPHEAVLAAMDENIHGPRVPRHVTITNTESMYYARRRADHRRMIETAAFSLCDGVGVVLAARFQGRTVGRFNGPILVLEAADYGVSRGWRHYFCGGRPGVADRMAAGLRDKYPGLIVAGSYCPPFRTLTDAEEAAMVEEIRAARPDIVWVGLGLLKQEAWIERFRDRIGAPWMAGVGAAFDYHAGTARWAPAPWRRLGLEWLYRLFFEPRMFVRNVRSFVFLVEGALAGVFGRAPVIGGRER